MARRDVPPYQYDFLEGLWGSMDIPAGSYDRISAVPLPTEHNISRMALYINDQHIGSKFPPFENVVVWDFKPNFYTRTDIPKVHYFDYNGNLVYMAHIETTTPVEVEDEGPTTSYDLSFLNSFASEAIDGPNVMCLNTQTGDFSYKSNNTHTGVWQISGRVVISNNLFPGSSIREFYGRFQQFPLISLDRLGWDLNALKPGDYNDPPPAGGGDSPQELFNKWGCIAGFFYTPGSNRQIAIARVFNPRWVQYYTYWKWITEQSAPPWTTSQQWQLAWNNIRANTAGASIPTGFNSGATPFWGTVAEPEYGDNDENLCSTS